MANYNMGSSDMDGMGGAMALIVAVFVLIWAALKHSDSKIQNNAIQQNQQKQAAAKAGFTREFGENQQFDSTDLYISERVVDFAQATTGLDKFETVKSVAGMVGGFKKMVAGEASKATAEMIKNQIENNRQNMQQIPGQAQQAPQQPIYIERPRRQRQVIIEEPDREPEYIYRPRRPYNHYDY